ncbi:MAG: hypothetical protein AVDCRST_MAG48-2415 [uncultured Friedmanniella sp.]|uniref:Uncharacterized protein n=1 Tax=uncultured Friedmanniella sp. TaxID=335381 RepID=A0A6J4KVY2_9ACTN|nr:MAG: hypothetical protein AVDCRST_MAG48-2415 [uncultured Friedmanniella sp.]
MCSWRSGPAPVPLAGAGTPGSTWCRSPERGRLKAHGALSRVPLA